MKKEELIKLIDNFQEVLPEHEFLIVGSQAIIGSPRYHDFKDDNILLYSEEADLICLNYAYEDSLILEAVFGEESYYHQTHHCYIQLVTEKTCCLINNYQYCLHKLTSNNKTIYFLDEETLFISKMLANREKDKIFCQQMIRQNLINQNVLKLLEKNKNYLINTYQLNHEIIESVASKTAMMFERKKNEIRAN